MYSLCLNDKYDIVRIKKMLHINIDKYVALEDKSDILKKANDIIKKANTEIILTLFFKAKRITNGILKKIIVARIFLFPYSPISLVFWSYVYSISFIIKGAYAINEKNISTIKLPKININSRLTEISFLEIKNFMITKARKKVIIWKSLTEDSTKLIDTNSDKTEIAI